MISIGLDIGTTKICVIAAETGSGKIVYTESVPGNSDLKLNGSKREQDPFKIKEISLRLLDKASKKFGRNISGIGLTGQMHGMLYLDKDLKPLGNLITWQDKRAEKLIPEIRKKTGRNDVSACGCYIHPGYMAATLYWHKKNKKTPRNAHKASFIYDWIGASLSGELYTDPTSAASSGIFNIKKMGWDGKITGALSIDPAILPVIRSSGAQTGRTKEGIPVFNAIGDNQASILGSINGLSWDEILNINIGTGSQVSVIIKGFRKAGEGMELRPFFNGRNLLVGASMNGGSAYAVLNDLFRAVRDKRKEDIYSLMNKYASNAEKDCEGLFFMPYFFGERGRPALAGYISGIKSSNFTKENISRALLKGMVTILHDLYVSSGAKRKTAVCSGNAIRKNKVLQEEIKNIFGVKLVHSAIAEEAAYGAAIIASTKCEVKPY